MTILELDGVEKRFGGLPAVDGVTFEVDEGEIVALVGPNGAGKTTLLRLISGLDAADRGTIRFMGTDLTGRRAARDPPLGRGHGAADSEDVPVDDTLENAALGRHVRQHRRPPLAVRGARAPAGRRSTSSGSTPGPMTRSAR